MKILYTTAFSDVIGGGQEGLLLLLERLDRKDFSPILLVSREGEVSERARKIGCDVRIFPFPPLRSIFEVFPALFRYRRLLKEEKVDIIHTDEPRSTLYSAFARLGLRARLAWHIRTMLADRLDPILEWGVDYLILVAGLLAGRFSDRGRRKSVVIYNGIDPDDIPAVDTSRLPPIHHPLLICPARLHEPKGQYVLLEALPPAVEEFPQLSVWFVGRGEEEYVQSLKRQISQKGLEGRVHFLGYRSDLRGLYAFADLVVLPSFHEAFPRILLEAMSAGKAVVATSVGGIPEAVLEGKTGILVPPRDAGKLGEALLRLLKDPARMAAMGQEARRHVERFSIESMVRSIEDRYREWARVEPPSKAPMGVA